jgi:GNAT superfamily N-acetyltransferase
MARSPYVVRRVDSTDEDTAIDIQFLDKLAFAPGNGEPDLDSGDWWLAFKGKQPVAYAGLCWSPHMQGYGYLCRAGVHPEHRGHGLQGRLLRARENRAKQLDMLGLVTDTTGNVPSSNNLIKAGFKMFTPGTMWAFGTSNYWKKELQ